MIHKDMLGELVLSGTLCIGCAAFGLVGLFSPDLFGWNSPNPFLVNIGLVILVLMPFIWIPGLLLHLRSASVYRTTLPVCMNVRIEIEESDDVDIPKKYFVILKKGEIESQEERIRVRTTGWNRKPIERTMSGLVFFDPESKKPLVIEIDGKRLWSME